MTIEVKKLIDDVINEISPNLKLFGEDVRRSVGVYGHWIATDGEMVPVIYNHFSVACKILEKMMKSGKISIEKYNLLFPKGQGFDVSNIENYLYGRGWIRGINDRNYYYVNGAPNQRLTPKQKSTLIQLGMEHHTTVEYRTRGEDVYKGTETIYDPYEILQEGIIKSKYIKPLIELAKKFDNFEDFQFHYSCKNFHGVYWHLTNNPNFQINPTQSPRDASSMATGGSGEPGLMVTTDISNWYAKFKGTRKYVALIDLTNASPNIDYRETSRGFGNEMYVFKPEKARVVKVLSIQQAKRLQNNIYKKILPQSIEELRKIYDIVHQETLKESISSPPDKKHEKAARFFIYNVWRRMPNEDKYSTYQFSLWMDYEQHLQNMLERISTELYPGDDDAREKFFDKDIVPTLEKLEDRKNSLVAKKINSSDPLFILKNIVKNKSFERAKQDLFKSHLHNWWYKGEKVSDEDAQIAFERLYKHAMGETRYDIDMIGKLPILSNLTDKTDDATERIFVQHYVGYKTGKFPDMVKVWRGTNSPLNKIKPGDFITFDPDYAASYMRGKFGAKIKDILPAKDIRVYRMDVDNSEMVYWPEGHSIKKYFGEVPNFKDFWNNWQMY